MGPQLVSRGNGCFLIKWNRDTDTLQWGRSLLAAEIRDRDGLASVGERRFNGAAAC